MQTKRFQLSLLLVLVTTIVTLQANSQPTGQPKSLLAEAPHLKNLLREEMRAVQPAMNRIVNALPQGDWQTVAHTAEAIHNSFIMQQKLTAKDRATLHSLLPEEFIRLDQEFHRQAGKLQLAAEQHDAELSHFYTSKMLGMCMECHRRFAPHRFPQLSGSPLPDRHH
jgi:hypothetical protein